jgi:hypothetical protein
MYIANDYRKSYESIIHWGKHRTQKRMLFPKSGTVENTHTFVDTSLQWNIIYTYISNPK